MADIIEPVRLLAFEYRGRMKGGRTQPLLIACSDDSGNETQVVLKVRSGTVEEGSFGPCSLACELVCSVLARAAGLTVPDYAIVEIEEDFVQGVPDRRDRERLLENLGENFGSVYQEDCARFHPGRRLDYEGQCELESILAFDDYVLNNDRQASNPNLLIRGDNLYLIDHSLCFPHLVSPGVREPWNEFLPESSIRSHCTYASLKLKEPAFQVFSDFIANELKDADIHLILSLVPDRWQRPETLTGHKEPQVGGVDHLKGDKENILQYLLKRSSRFIGTEPSRLAEVCGS